MSLSDQIYNMATGQKEIPVEGPGLLDLPESLPKVLEKRSTIKAPEETPYVLTKDKVQVYNKDPTEARIFKNICENADVWRDRGPIDMTESERMRIPLVEG
ncbi:hypothetical protein GGTG_14434 [Gaeumannomyces tritici R3-111a-1]|uniref:Uncharacterized protein n=1 Tax=Gaeumannomyces tritici (strain R3-111a-1) TaxID=644352 RepID=J3PLG3_GAET3|nr:hypothetical protein GGTG_14434 [Gaeumannomyces tritici R3-111a-1]EJT67989.1 hypothetical protein GGTG_14434 [Gaeumannomyces tritici R3-111a-1]